MKGVMAESREGQSWEAASCQRGRLSTRGSRVYDRRFRSEVVSCDGKQGGGILANRKRDLAGESCLVYIGQCFGSVTIRVSVSVLIVYNSHSVIH